MSEDYWENRALIAETNVARLKRERDEALSILKGEQAIAGAFGKTRLWGALEAVLSVVATDDELDQIMRLLNANSNGIAAATSGEGEDDAVG